MSLSKISTPNAEAEKVILNNIFKAIDDNERIIFNSGAGSGKTHSLIESLRHILNKHGKRLKDHKQKIVCITYTNVATSEVKDRLGKNDLVLVSTIHERIWSLIKSYRNELVDIHKEKILEEMQNIEDAIISDNVYAAYSSLSETEKGKFRQLSYDKKPEYYIHYNDKAADFKNALSDFNIFPDSLKNVGNFKKIVSAIYKLDDYRKCLSKIDSSFEGYTEINYNASYNRDRLHRMRISHDTLLEYGFTIVERYDLLKQIIIDSYPYFLIDEYQDTSELVVKIMKILSDYSEKIKHDFFVAYFGDAVQNIYSDGIGSSVLSVHSDLKKIYKNYNRRSNKEIIDVINKIRNDEVSQESIYEDSDGGSVKFYTGDKEQTDDFISKYLSGWNASSDNKLHCLFLTNKTVAQYSGFFNIYETFSNTQYYKQNFDQINTELLSEDASKLGEIPSILNRVMNLRIKLLDGGSQISHILDSKIYKSLNIIELRQLIDSLKSIEGDTLGDYVESMLEQYRDIKSDKFKEVILRVLDLENYTYKNFKNYLLTSLYSNLKDDERDSAEENINRLLEISMSEYELWLQFRMNKQGERVAYHTYHGTKGREYENVIIVMENAFGRVKHYFDYYFINRAKAELLCGDEKRKYEEARNLLYVSCSRAIKNLRVFYFDDISSFQNEVEEIFGKVYKFQPSS